ncbi:hypothetical protein BDZ89DRAFT_1104271 [Hymenopellis radicata]|nr:hypothetical protein BDZ89DRAFT_1104271 [Hymenopellis radicata]
MSTQPPPPRRVPHTRYILGGLGGLGFYLVGTLYPPEEIRLLYPPRAPPPIADLTSPEAINHVNNLEDTLQSLPILRQKREDPDADEWYETRPYANAPADRRVNHLTGGALRGPGKLALPPLVRAKKDESEAWILVHLGRECAVTMAFVNLPEKVGVTATLTLSYRAPTRADQFVVIRTKVWVSGSIEDLKGKLLVEAKAMFVQPKYAALLNKTQIAQAVGAPLPPTIPPAADGEPLTS